jgi:hypothetical protein
VDTKIKNCNTIFSRFLGMMGLSSTNVGYYFRNCHSIHTCFCHFDLDVILLDKNNQIIDIQYHLKPWKFYFFKCYSILEFQSGKVPFNIKEIVSSISL